MIQVTYTCDFGPETATGSDSRVLPAQWTVVSLSVGPMVTNFLACPLHQELTVTVFSAVASPPETETLAKEKLVGV